MILSNCIFKQEIFVFYQRLLLVLDDHARVMLSNDNYINASYIAVSRLQ